jgi:tetratricopeptide (TPR) repeat protein
MAASAESERWKSVKTLAALLMATDRGQWSALLAESPADIAEQARAWAEQALAEPAEEDAPAPRRLKQSVSALPAKGARLGPYRLGDVLGEGGTGVVFHAHREGDFHQEAAVKILHADYSPDARARFLREREILARLGHPYIARILDGGATPEGKLYLVVEYVPGTPITAYARTFKLTTKQRLDLFLKVCSAAQYLHQSLIVHRDLKPDNILVPAHGDPKLLDFGVAKLLENRDSSGGITPGITTAFAPLTPEYASPEQIAGDPITIASDVYSLGVILYELLSGQRPRQFSNRDWLTVSRELHTLSPAPLPVERDLNAIVQKSIAINPTDRYASVANLVHDLQRFQNGEPVQALSHARGYRVLKAIRRNRWPLAAASLIIASLGTGLYTTRRENRIAQEQRARAERFAQDSTEQRRLALASRDRAAAQTVLAEKRLADVRKLSQTYLFNIHEKIRNLSGSLPAQQEVVRVAIEYLESLRRESGADPSFLLDLAEAYLRIGTIQGDAVTASFGKSEDAEKSYRTAIDLARQVEASGTDIRSRRIILRATQHRSAIGVISRDWDAAERLANESIRLAHDELQRHRTNLDSLADLVRSHTYRGNVEYARRNLPAAIDAYTQGTKLLTFPAQRYPANAPLISSAASLYSVRASTYGERGSMDEAIADQTIAYTLAGRNVQLEPNSAIAKQNLAQSARLLGRWYISRGKFEEVGRLFTEALALNERVYAENPGDVRSKRDLGQSLTYLINYNLETAHAADALPLCRRKIALADDLAADNPNNLVYQNDRLVARGNLADTLIELREFEAAEEHVATAIALARQLAAKGSKFAESEMPNLALRLLQTAHSANARDAISQANRLLPASPANPFIALLKASSLRQQARLERSANPSAAAQACREALHILAPVEKISGLRADAQLEQQLAAIELALATATDTAPAVRKLESLAAQLPPRQRVLAALALLDLPQPSAARPAFLIDALTPIVQQQPWNAPAQRALALAHAAQRAYQSAAHHQQQALAQLPPPPSENSIGRERRAWNQDLARFRTLAAAPGSR